MVGRRVDGFMADAELSATELSDLREIAGTMVPASAEFDMPGADDPVILADIAKSIGRDLPLVRQAQIGRAHV